MDSAELELARKAYNAYGESTGGKNFRGDPMPEFDALPVAIKNAWLAAVAAVVPGCSRVTIG